MRKKRVKRKREEEEEEEREREEEIMWVKKTEREKAAPEVEE